MSDARHLHVPDGLFGERADAGLARLLGMSRTQVATLIADGNVSLDGAILAKSSRLHEGMISVTLPEVKAPGPEPLIEGGITIVHEDKDIIVVDKPVGVAAHGAAAWAGPTVVGALLARGVRLAENGIPERQGIVHRLDVGTSGLMVLTKSPTAYSALKRAFKERTVTKVYHAVAQGHLSPPEGTVNAPIGRHPKADYKFAVIEGGRESVTHYKVLEAMTAASLLEIHLETGRTHQIRVHMSALHHPLAGDTTYGADPVLAKRLGLTRQWLHAVSLSFTHPGSGERFEVTSEYPDDLTHALATLRG